jgi:hypothetical protein
MPKTLSHRGLAAAAVYAAVAMTAGAADIPGARALDRDFEKKALPVLKEYCLGCHSTEKHKGDLDLERFKSVSDIVADSKVWQGVLEQIALGEMPPKEKPQPSESEREKLVGWVHSALDAAGKARAGDPGPVVLRRLNNAEYTYTIRDLTGVPSLDPAAEFPTDSASGEGFMNVGNSLVMSPSLVTKYLDAGKAVAAHAVLLPDGIRFSPSTTRRDWTEELLADIRGLYREYTDNGGGTSVNLQGIRFDTKDGGVLPLDRYLVALLEERSGKRKASDVPAGLSAKYLRVLKAVLEDKRPNFLLDPIRARWRSAKPEDAPSISADLSRWQHALWKFNSVGHIGKRDGPKSWMEPLTPIQAKQEIRMAMPAASTADEVTLYLSASDAGDGNNGDVVVWEQPRLVAPGRPQLLLRDVRGVARELSARRSSTLAKTAQYLAAVAESDAGRSDIAALARDRGLEQDTLGAWMNYLGMGAFGPVKIEGHFTTTYTNVNGYAFISGWGPGETPNVTGNSSDQHVRIPGNMKPHSIAMHPSPKLAVVAGWRSPAAGRFRVTPVIQHAHPECGNGVTWAVELRRGPVRQRLASGVAHGGNPVKPSPIENLSIQVGDVVSLVIGPRDGNHSCDQTAVDLTLTALGEGGREWDLAKDVSPNVTAANPHADRFGNEGVWHFYTEPDKGGATSPTVPADSLLAKWKNAPDAAERTRLASEVQQLLVAGKPASANSPDAVLYRQATSLGGPLFSGMIQSGVALVANASSKGGESAGFGYDPERFGKRPDGSAIGEANLCVQAPAVVEVRLPADLVAGYEFVTSGTLDTMAGAEGSVQFQVLTNKPAASSGLLAIEAKTADGQGPWYSNNRTTSHNTPVVVNDGSAARKRVEAAFDEFRQTFPAALCYTKIVPVDEVVTLTLYYREDEHFKRLMLDDAGAARLDRMWDELHYVAEDDLRMVDVFEQLWQYATQDADPSVFEPMREPIKQRAAAFRKKLVDTQPSHVDAVLRFAENAYRRPLKDAEKGELRALYQTLRAEEISHEEAVRLVMARSLVAPAFLYRAEKPAAGEKAAPVDDWELATRLSYFLWSSAPDTELRAVASSGKLHKPEVLAAHSKRMLKDARTRRLATEFACAWLHVYDFDELGEKSESHFPTFTGLRGAMYEETIRFFTDLLQNDGSVLDILDADYTFLNAELAKHYGITHVKFDGDEWRKVTGVKKQGRGGILGQATTLAKQSGASRTSPILRGNWLCEVLLGEKLPKPPKDVPRLPEDEATETLTVRQLTEKHTSDPKCYGCHRRIDPYGYSLEAYDAIGRLRDRDLGGRVIDVKTKVMDGAEIEGLDGLRRYLLTRRREAFVKQFCRKLLGYSLGRGLLLSDEPLITEMAAQLKKRDYKIGVAIETIVRSKQFREIRGKEMASAE